LEIKRLGRKADHSPSSSAEVKNAWSYTSTPHYVFMGWCLVKHREILPLRGIFGPKREEIAGGYRRLHNEELHNLYTPPNIVIMIKSVTMG
jgi:hypothetical protein